ncbi:hypothetical protein LJC22_05690 [Desulfosarcina sp. OttesenSCG-928-G10]|nr:hypothetical protein [Desulfosarcina sp. OttesenSCG-928-G10]
MNEQQISVPDERRNPMPYPMDSSDIMMADMIVDYITGRKVPHIGAEANRQQVERYLVEKKRLSAGRHPGGHAHFRGH